MICLHCGVCCKKFNPFNDKLCPYIIEDDDFIFCGVYNKRPGVCKNHKFHSRYCPLGMGKLKLMCSDKIAERIDEGYKRIKSMEAIR